MKRTDRCFLALRWFINARYGAVVGVLLVWLVARLLLGSQLDPVPVLVVLPGLLLFNAMFHWCWHLQARRKVTPDFSFISRQSRGQMVVDLAALSALLHFYGGIESPFALLFFWHIVISCFFEQRENSFRVFLFASGLYLGIVWLEFFGVMPHHQLPGFRSLPAFDDAAWVAGSSVAFVFSGAVLWYLTAMLSSRVQRREVELEILMGKLAITNEELQRTQELKEGFFRTVAHEMKRPTTATIQLLDAVRSVYGDTMDPKALDFITRAQTRAESAFSLIKDLIQFARLERVEESTTIARPASPDSIIPLLEEYRPVANHKSVTLILDLQASSSPVAIEESDLALVVSNLVSNAIRYSKPGGTVTVRSGLQDQRLLLSVADQGIGMSAEEQTHLFQEFYRSTEAKRHSSDGSGLGLAIVKRIVDRARGTIECNSVLGVGTTFTVSLPLMA